MEKDKVKREKKEGGEGEEGEQDRGEREVDKGVEKMSNAGRYGEQYLLEFYSKTLLSMPCQNQGFILDGFPKTFEQAKTLFDGGWVFLTWSLFYLFSHSLYFQEVRRKRRKRGQKKMIKINLSTTNSQCQV